MIVCGVAVATPLLGMTLPSSLPMVPRHIQTIDPEFATWLATHAEGPNALEIEVKDLDAHLAKQDPITAEYIRLLRRAKDAPQDKSKLPVDDKLWELMRQEAEKAQPLRHPLVGDLASALGEGYPEENQRILTDLVAQEPSYSCVRKASLIESIQRPDLDKMDGDELRKLINVANEYESLTHRRKLLDAIATAMPVKRRSEFVENIREVGGNLPLLIRRHQWLQNDQGTEGMDPWHGTMRAVRKRDCARATKDFSAVLQRSNVNIQIPDVLEVGGSVERCWRTAKRQAALDFWEGQRSLLKKRFGEVGNAWAEVRKGYLLWSFDRNEEAVAVYKAILQAVSDKPEFKAIAAKATYTLGKIAENRSDFDEAIVFYTAYVDRYPDGEDFEFALNSMVVARASKSQWTELVYSLRHFLDQQALVSLDERPIGNMAFSLFWLGRAHLSLGQPDQAKEMWRRLAAEYYSTFYGAMGHYLLEQTAGKVFALEPSRVTGFRFESLLTDLSPKQQSVARKTSYLLRAGLYEQARCEVEEISSQDKNNKAQLVRAMMLHAGGAWLEAIKIYDAMPRSVRNSLPVGFERILFPRRYAELVQSYAVKLGLDADLVFAVMRQESVFAKEAMSPVGAMGLMQLMPSTASLELSKLPRSYVDGDTRSEIRRQMQSTGGLLEPEVNVPLGVHHLSRLLHLYKSPVFALTAYNASPAATVKWKRTIATDDLMTFIERIPYKETRAYVKLILRNYFYYKRWYGPSQELKEIHLESLAHELIAMAKNGQKSE